MGDGVDGHQERCAASTSVERGIKVSWDVEVVEE